MQILKMKSVVKSQYYLVLSSLDCCVSHTLHHLSPSLCVLSSLPLVFLHVDRAGRCVANGEGQ